MNLVFVFTAFTGNIFSQDSYPDEFNSEPLAEQLREVIQHEAFTVNIFVKSGLRYSFLDDNFQNGRTFEVSRARLGFRGMIDRRFFYRVIINLVREPNLTDAFIGYHHSDELRITAGAHKPNQTLDFIPPPDKTDFVDRTKITGLLVQSREIGVSAEGDINDFYYFAGVFNGNRLSVNNNNRFYGIGRLQYTIPDLIPGNIQVAISGSHGNSEGVRSGSTGPVLRGERTIYGADLRIDNGRYLFAAEYLAGNIETEEIEDRKETISGYYCTCGYRLLERTITLARWQSWAYRDPGLRDHQLTIGLNHDFTELTALQVNLDAYFPDIEDSQYGLSVMLQVKF
jgi:hypothetical protein